MCIYIYIYIYIYTIEREREREMYTHIFMCASYTHISTKVLTEAGLDPSAAASAEGVSLNDKKANLSLCRYVCTYIYIYICIYIYVFIYVVIVIVIVIVIVRL